MSPLLASSAASAPASSTASKAPARASEQDQNQPGSFGEILTRSRPPAAEKPMTKAVKTATPAPTRPKADAENTDPQAIANPMAALLLPFESRTAAAAPTGASAVARTDTALSDLLTGAAADTPGVAPDTDAQSALASVLATVDPRSPVRTPLQAQDADISDSAVMATEPRTLAAQAKAAGAGLPDPSSRQGDKDETVAPAVGDENSALTRTAAEAAAGTSPALLQQPAMAALQAPGNPVASNMPVPIATGFLAPEVGSSEWSKALGQQVIHLGTAQHQVAELQLNPPGLGPLKVTLSMNDQQMQAMFVSAHSSVRAAVEAALPQLRSLLAENGISLGNTSVGAESQSQTAFSNGQEGRHPPSARNTYRSTETGTAAFFHERPNKAQVRLSPGMRIDTYA